MRAYKNENGMVDIFLNEPDETITVEEFEARKAEDERRAKIEEHLAALRELGVVINLDDGDSTASEMAEEATTPTTRHGPVEVPMEPAPTTFKARRW